MKPICLLSDNPTGAHNPCLGRCETQLELAIETTWKELDMKTATILNAETYDLHKNLCNKTLTPATTRLIRIELAIRYIVNTSIDDSKACVATLEADKEITNPDKLYALQEAERREMASQRRLTLVGKIRATKKRLMKQIPAEETAA